MYSELLNLLWGSGHLSGRRFDGVAGEAIEIVSPGELDEEHGVWYGAEAIVAGERRRGDVIVGEGVSDKAILRVVSGYSRPLLDFGDRLIPQINYRIDGAILECYDTLRAGTPKNGCARRLGSMDALRRTDLFTKLLVARLQRKCGDMMQVFETAGKDWNQTFHVMLLRALGGDRNREAFTLLGERVTSAMVSREKGSPERVEALLLGASGFLYAAEDKDPYTLKLETEFRHLANKHSIVPLKPAQWDLKKLYMANHPALRLAQIAALLSKKDFLLDTCLGCRDVGDVDALFTAGASEYWTTHYKPGAVAGVPSPGRIGKSKARLIGINLAVPLMFAYGKETGNEELCEHALDLLETIPAEKNRKLDGWDAAGCTPRNGFESQALLELNNEFCGTEACARCSIGRMAIKKACRIISPERA